MSRLEATVGALALPSSTARGQGFNLFLVGFLVLFLELACIRWFAAYVVFLQFFTNITLIACFLGMSCGCLAARSERDWLRRFPILALGTVIAALAVFAVYSRWTRLAIDVGHQASPQEVFFGTEFRAPDAGQFYVPIELLVAPFFVLIALMFVGPGQVLGRAFDAFPKRVLGYSLNIGGSLAGIIGFSLLSALQAPPVAWFLVVALCVGYFLRQTGGLSWLRVRLLVILVAAVWVPSVQAWFIGHDIRWSPYYAVDYDPGTGNIIVNRIGHQNMYRFDASGAPYSLIHLLQAHSGGPPFRDVLVIGAGSGNDIDHALHFGVGRVDAVEIDPAILDIGIHNNPDHPYQDPRVIPHVDDGRHFLRTTDRKYDLVVYALVDSLILHSSYANIRLESYLFTKEAFADIKRVLKPGGVFVTYNYFRQGWIVERVAAMAEETFGCKPLLLSLPYQPILRSSSPSGFEMIISGCNQQIAEAFAAHGSFWLSNIPPRNLRVDGFAIDPARLPAAERPDWQRIAPTVLVHDEGPPAFASDDWPFLYLHGRLIPDLNLRSTLLLGVLGLGMVYVFRPRRRGVPQGGPAVGGRMFFLGAAFMLLETRAVVQLALLFGSTWLVNSLVFAAALILILLANLYVLKVPGLKLVWHYAGLLAILAAAILTPVDVFLEGGLLWHYAAPCFLALGPMFFAGIVFARTFRDAGDPDRAFGFNIAGAVVGGYSESLSMLLGFRYLLLIAVLFYLLSALAPRFRLARAMRLPTAPQT